jgi:hypothetical protein
VDVVLMRAAIVLCLMTSWGCGGPVNEEVDAGAVDAQPPPDAIEADAMPICPDDVCQCQVDADCGDHAACSVADGVGTCSCVAGYYELGGFCQWVGLLNAGFDESPVVWDTGGTGAFLLDAAINTFLRWNGVEVQNMAVATQSLDVPAYDLADPLVAVMRWRRRNVGADIGLPFYGALPPTPAFAINGAWQSFYSQASDLLQFHEVRECLGDEAYGATVEVAFGSNESPPYRYLMDVDSFNVIPAESGECPAPGEILNADFEGLDGWSYRSCPLDNGCTTTHSVGISDTGIDGRSGELVGDCPDNGSLDGRASFPTPAGPNGLALEFDWSGTTGHFLSVGLGASKFSWWFGRVLTNEAKPIGTLHGDGTTTTSRVCVPPWAHGKALSLKFQLHKATGAVNCDTARNFEVDNLAIVSDASCPTTGMVDGDFELSGGSLLSGWLLPRLLGLYAEVLDNTAEARNVSGTGALRITKEASRAVCSPIRVMTSAKLPEIASNRRHKVSAYYKFMPGTDQGFGSIGIASDALPNVVYQAHPGAGGEGAYQLIERCLDPRYNGRAVSLGLEVRLGDPGSAWACDPAYLLDQVVYLDDVAITDVDATTGCP